MVKPIMRDVLFLGQKSIPATEEDLQVGRDLQDTLAANREACVGMAANMIGVKKRIIIVNAAKAAPTKQKKAAFPCQACGKQSGTRTSKSNTTTGIGKNNARNSPAGQPRSASMRWIIWKGYLFRSYSRQEDSMTDRE